MLQPSLLMGGQAATATGGASFDRHNPLDGQVATRAPAAAMPAPNSTWDGARRTAKSVIGRSPGTR